MSSDAILPLSQALSKIQARPSKPHENTGTWIPRNGFSVAETQV